MRRQIWDLQSGVLTPHETPRVATMFGVEALGLQKDLGSIQAGKLADLIVLDKRLRRLAPTTPTPPAARARAV
jgi:imidazolonepropionase-like amidohydrolase